MSEHLNREEEDLLQSALSTAFSPADLPRQPAAPLEATQPPAPSAPAASPTPAHPPPAPLDAVPAAESTEDVWKAEYEQNLAEWRRQNAEQREKAERTRAEWEAVRERERREGKSRESVLSLGESHGGWETLGASAAGSSSSAPLAEPAKREGASGGAKGGEQGKEVHCVDDDPPPAHDKVGSNPTSEPDSKQDKWDSMASSMTSSFPSMSFPSDPHSPLSSGARRDLAPAPVHTHGHGHHHGHHEHHDIAPRQEERRTATVSVFDSSLSPKTRALALVSSLAINLLLPFVNGVMLGFGEIFARNVVVQWLGWKIPGTASTAGSRGSGRVASSVGFGRR
ncbi:uncharacterized protein BXZ73DRAFT_73435 [Epithele typhae]|uniref:uncharacterized protein n=1 Tax=Epithele typhae TaxID=378194 RepID=UPI0020086719|nr:uncharacterized protein BXZ73DRAFT_73435 [Epithele typhae]KAH9945274.1 hypothetical protein BXZ73DRAFT_73435 [Epithele typhae]